MSVVDFSLLALQIERITGSPWRRSSSLGDDEVSSEAMVRSGRLCPVLAIGTASAALVVALLSAVVAALALWNTRSPWKRSGPRLRVEVVPDVVWRKDDGGNWSGWIVACSVYNDGRTAASVQASAMVLDAEGKWSSSKPHLHMKPEFRDEWKVMVGPFDFLTFYGNFDLRAGVNSTVLVEVRSQGTVIKAGKVQLSPFPED